MDYALGVLGWYISNAPIVVIWLALAVMLVFDTYRTARSR